MDIPREIGISVLCAIVQDLVKSTGRHFGYIFRFKSIMEDLNEETENLRWKLKHMQHRVDRAKRDTEEVEEDVQKWLRDVRDAVAYAENMEKESREKQTCLNGWCPNWIWKYQLAKKAKKKKSFMKKLGKRGEFYNFSHRTTLSGVNVFSQKDFVPFESNQHSFNQIIEALKDDKINVVGLYGMGGVGKTTLAKAVVNKIKEENIFNKVVMVVVSQNSNIKSIQGQIADFLNFKLHEESIEGRAERLYMRIKNEKKILIILDDVWAKLELTTIGIMMEDPHKDCKIFLTTRRQQVCIDMDCQLRIPLDVLNEEEGLLLLKRQAGLSDDFPTLIQLAKEVANECKGLPLAIVTIGRALKEKSIHEWKTMIQKLKKSKLTDVGDVDEKVYACLKLSYDYLRNEKTKLCFLLCSLFPEDLEIDMEELLRYGLGLGWYQDTDSIEEARSELCVMVNHLKDLSLLLDANYEGFVKMHDVVRDVALWITSKGENAFMVKAGMGLTEWPKHDGLEHCMAISLIGNEIEVLPDDLVCPKLLILLLGSYSDLYNRSEIGEIFFEEMKALKVVTLVRKKLSLKSLQSLTNLVTLQLIDCELRDIFSLKKLAKLEILWLQNSMFDESLLELKELSKLRMLDLSHCDSERTAVDVIPRLSLYENVEYLSLCDIIICCQNIVPIVGETGLNKLTRLFLQNLDEMECIVDMMQQHVPSTAFSNLVHLSLDSVDLREFCNGGRPPRGFLGNLETLEVESCDRMSCLFPALLIQRVRKLKEVNIYWCNKLQDVFQLEGLCYAEENPFLLSSLANLDLYELPNLRNIWKGPTQQVSLQSLTVVEVDECNKLRYVFTWNLARSLLHLRRLLVSNCESLEHIVEIEAEETEDIVAARDGNDVVLPKLRKLELRRVEKLINFCSENYSSTWPALQEVILSETPSFVAEFGANMRIAKETLRVLYIEKGSDKFCKAALAQLTNNFKNLEELSISDCRGVQVIFELEREISLPSLKKLKLKGLEDLECLYKGPAHLLSLPNLQQLEVDGCKRLRHLLSSTHARNLLQLEMIYIWYCEELEQIFRVEDDREDHVLFPNLSSIDVAECHKLKTLFPFTVDQLRLQQLISLRVMRSPQLENIFGDKDGADMASDTELKLLLPQLRSLTIVQLKSLVNCCPSCYHFVFPSLSWLEVKRCPKITTRFSVDQNGIVHAQVEAPYVDKEHLDMEHTPPETARDIFCERSYHFRQNLPAYIGT